MKFEIQVPEYLLEQYFQARLDQYLKVTDIDKMPIALRELLANKAVEFLGQAAPSIGDSVIFGAISMASRLSGESASVLSERVNKVRKHDSSSLGDPTFRHGGCY